MQSIVLELPWPPSVNRYWRMWNGRMLISREGRAYKTGVSFAVQCHENFTAASVPMCGDLKVEIDLYPPDRRKRDIDNTQKAILDSLGHAGVYEDDSQIVELNVCKREVVKHGRAVVRISEARG